MPDVRGWRKKFGVLAPSTNTMVEPDFYMMAVPGVTAHISRIFMANTSRDGDTTEATEQRQGRLEEEMKPTIERVLTAEPDYMVMGMSAPTFRDGVEGNRRWKARMQQYSGGLGMANGAEACERALTLLGVKRIGVLTPYWASTSSHVISFSARQASRWWHTRTWNVHLPWPSPTWKRIQLGRRYAKLIPIVLKRSFSAALT